MKFIFETNSFRLSLHEARLLSNAMQFLNTYFHPADFEIVCDLTQEAFNLYLDQLNAAIARASEEGVYLGCTLGNPADAPEVICFEGEIDIHTTIAACVFPSLAFTTRPPSVGGAPPARDAIDEMIDVFRSV
jgi:hypothetical protein